MNVEKYTDRTKGFIQAAQTLAVREGLEVQGAVDEKDGKVSR